MNRRRLDGQEHAVFNACCIPGVVDVILEVLRKNTLSEVFELNVPTSNRRSRNRYLENEL